MEDAKSSNEISYLLFTMGRQEFGMEVSCVREIIGAQQEIVSVPKTGCFVKGVINLRGEIISVTDIAGYLGLSVVSDPVKNRIVVCEIKEKKTGFPVDEVREVITIPVGSIQPPTAAFFAGAYAVYMKGITNYKDRVVMIMDFGLVLGRIIEHG